jgi:hypothetical protein
MAKVLCPCNCGERFEPKINGTSVQIYFSPACANRMRQQRWRDRQKKKKRIAVSRKQRSLQFRPAAASSERCKKARIEQKQQEQLFA